MNGFGLKGLFLIFISLLLSGVVHGRFHCHNRCSGHGVCSDYDNVCYCKEGYQGVACNERTCPKDFAWADKAYALDTAHQLAECSNAGRCNRKTGKCECSAGFMGLACENTICGGSGRYGCNGHGECLTLGETYELIATRRGLNVTAQYIAEPPSWEATHTTMCACHMGYAGASCEYRLCPKGDDLLTPRTGFRTITLTLAARRRFPTISGEVLFQFNGESFLFETGATRFTAAQCKTAFEALRNVAEVDCTITTSTDFLVTYQIVFKSFPVLPYENNIFSHDGNPALASFSCNTDQIVNAGVWEDITCTIGELNTDKSYPEYAICSNRGICDFEAGICHCFEQFVDANCGSYKKAIAEAELREVSSSEVMVIESSNPDFDKTILKFQTFDIGTSIFNTILVKNLDRILFVLDGYGNVQMNYGGLTIGEGLNTLSSGMTINTGGLRVTGGITAESNTLVIQGRTVVSGVTIGNGGMSVVGTSRFRAEATVTGGFSIEKGLNSTYGINVLAGGGTITTGGLMLYGGLSVAAGGITVNRRGVTVYTGGFVVSGGIQLLKVRSSINVAASTEIGSDGLVVTGGITAQNIGISAEGGVSIGSGGLIVQTATILSGGVAISGGLTVSTLGLNIAGGLTLQNTGLTVFSTAPSVVLGGGTVQDTGLIVTDGITVSTSGMVITGGVTLPIGDVTVVCSTPMSISSGAVITGGVTVSSAGMVVTNGITVLTSGLVIKLGGLTVSAGGLRVNNGLSVALGGLRVTAGVTVHDVGLYTNNAVTITTAGVTVTGGMTFGDVGVVVTNGGVTIANNGFTVTNGATLFNTGVMITGGLTVRNTGLVLTDGVTLFGSGLRVSGGLSVVGATPLVLRGGLSVINSGLNVEVSGASVLNGGLVTTGGFTVESGGLYITGGLTIVDSGLKVVLGGLSVMNSGLRVTDGMTVHDGTVSSVVNNALTVFSGVVVTAGWTVSTVGMQVGQGVTVSATGLKVTGGVTFSNGATMFGVSVQNNGLKINSGLTVNSAGVVMETQGLTILDTGLWVSGGVTVATNGLRVTGGTTINTGGLWMVNGATVFNTGLVVTDGVTINANGLTLTGAGNLDITSGGLVSADGLTIGASGFRITGGLTLTDVGLSTYTLRIRQGGFRSSDNVDVQDGLAVYGDSTVKSDGLEVVGGVTTRGLSFSSSTTAFTNLVDEGVVIKGASPVEVRNIGASTAEGLTVNGAVYLDTPPTTSDTRLKKNITGFSDPVGMVSALHGVYYNWIDPSWDMDSGRVTANTTDPLRFVGLIAQEVQRVLPEAVNQKTAGAGETSYLGVQYTELVALLIEAIKVLDERTAGIASVPPTSVLVREAAPRDSAERNGATRGWSNHDARLLDKYFHLDSATGLVDSVKAYVGECDCGEAALESMLSVLRRIEKLEAEEREFTRMLDGLSTL